MARVKVPPRHLTNSEIAAEREEYKAFVKDWQKRTGENLSHANRAWREHLIAKEQEEHLANSKKMQDLYRNPDFQKYLRGY